MKSSLLALFALVATLTSGTISVSEEDLLGRWSQTELIEDVTRYEPTDLLGQKGRWMEFKENGVLAVRQNSGWCGTPPISYSTYTGTYSISKDSLTLKHGFWGGKMESYYQIVATAKDRLDLRYLGMKQQRE